MIALERDASRLAFISVVPHRGQTLDGPLINHFFPLNTTVTCRPTNRMS